MGPNTTAVGTPNAAATCAVPVSFDITSDVQARTPFKPAMLVLPASIATGDRIRIDGGAGRVEVVARAVDAASPAAAAIGS